MTGRSAVPMWSMLEGMGGIAESHDFSAYRRATPTVWPRDIVGPSKSKSRFSKDFFCNES